MLKILFVLVIISYHGGVNTDLHFQNMAQCEAAREQVLASDSKYIRTPKATCIEMQIPVKKTECKIVNNFSYQNHKSNSNAHNLDGYPYPIALECVEE